MTTGIAYLLTSVQLAARLVVSLYTLRQWYDGPVTVFTTRKESHELGALLSNSELRVEHHRIVELPGESWGSSVATKPLIFEQSPYESTLLLDADTMIVGSLTELLEHVGDHELTVTTCGLRTDEYNQPAFFDNWRSLAGGRGDIFGIAKLLDCLEERPQWKINSGVVGAHRQAKILAEWPALSRLGQDLPTPEEVALQLLLLRYPHQVLGWKYNCFPFSHPHAEDVRIFHFCATTHLCHPITQGIWLPVYRECRRRNIARIRSWSRVRREPLPTKSRL
jgi:hypothetical protein